ncbi:MAG: hypothetical protein M3Q23_01110 [Actinomycetota bacterium]|nr:hypothetical protein [Actinomycetota bacterium]
MIRKLCTLAAMFTALGTIGMGANSAYAAGIQVPFRGSYSGMAVTDFSSGTVDFSGTGISTQLGLSANEGHLQVTGPDSSCAGGLANVRNETLTAANGDLLMLTSHDVACPIGPLVFHGTGHWVVTGGTGRFSGATGQGTTDGTGDFMQGVFTLQLTGTISAPNGG